MLTKNEEIELHIENLTLDGKTVSHYDGLVCFVRNGVPGDVVKARITKVKRNYAEADVLAVLSSSQHRVEPKCKYFGTCGGCKWQHVAYELQLQEKQQYVVDAFERIGGFQVRRSQHDAGGANLPISPIIGSEHTYFYRNKMEFSFSRQQWLTEPLPISHITHPISSSIFLGLHVPERFDKVVDIDECWLQSELSNGILNAVRAFCRERRLTVYSTKTHDGYLRHLVIRNSNRTNELMVNLVTTTDEPKVMHGLAAVLLEQFPSITTIINNITERKSMVAIGEQEKVYHGPGYITEKLGNCTFRISANSFFQTNTDQAERLYDIAGEFAELSPSDVVFDLYCGTGSIALYISDAAREVVGIDVVESAINDARLNAELNGVQNCRFVLGDLKEKLTKDMSWLTVQPDVVIVDPPRSGLHPKVVKEIAALSPSRVVYVSCNPATQARDAKMLCGMGFEITLLQPVDMFPHTPHVENVAVFRRRT
jgi:23S rRNA (uracil1939-C5)-methyltransferase